MSVAVACAKMVLLVTMHFMLCVPLPGTMDQKDSNVRDEVQSKRQKLMDWTSPKARIHTTASRGGPELGNVTQGGLEVRLSREWVRDLSFQAAAQRRGSTSVPRPNRCCKRSSATFLQPCDVGLMRPFKVDAIVMMSNEPAPTSQFHLSEREELTRNTLADLACHNQG